MNRLTTFPRRYLPPQAGRLPDAARPQQRQETHGGEWPWPLPSRQGGYALSLGPSQAMAIFPSIRIRAVVQQCLQPVFLGFASPLFSYSSSCVPSSSALSLTCCFVPSQVRIVKHAFEIISLLTDQNPVQTLVDAIINRCAIHAAMKRYTILGVSAEKGGVDMCIFSQTLGKS